MSVTFAGFQPEVYVKFLNVAKEFDEANSQYKAPEWRLPPVSASIAPMRSPIACWWRLEEEYAERNIVDRATILHYEAAYEAWREVEEAKELNRIDEENKLYYQQ